MKSAVFIDVESLAGWLKSAEAESELLALCQGAQLRRAYGNFSNASVSARQASLNRLGFELVHVFHPVRGKDSADIQMIVDVMEYASRIDDLDRLVLATGDSDFSPLFRRLREMGKDVVGVGPRSALSEVVRTSCTEYVIIEMDPSAGERPAVSPNEIAASILCLALGELPSPTQLTHLKCKMLELEPEFSERQLGHKRFLDFLRAFDHLVEISRGEKGAWFAARREPIAEPTPPAEDELAERRRHRRSRKQEQHHLQLVFDAFLAERS